MHVEIKIVNKEAATKRSTLLHAQRQPLEINLTLSKASRGNRLAIASSKTLSTLFLKTRLKIEMINI